MAVVRQDELACFRRRPFESPSLLLAGKRFHTGHQGTINRRTGYYLFHYLTDGRGTVTLPDGQKEAVDKGDWFFAFPDQTIGYKQDSNDPWRYFWFGFQGEGVDAILARAGIAADTGIRRGRFDPAVPRMLEEIIDTLDRHDHSSDLEANALFLKFLCHLIESTPDKDRLTEGGRLQNLGDSVDEACRFMTEHYATGMTVGDVSTHVGFERSYFSKVFSKACGTTIRDYLAHCRLIKAQELLEQGDLLVEEIAVAVGFSEARTFSHFFRRCTGISPKAWLGALSKPGSYGATRERPLC